MHTKFLMILITVMTTNPVLENFIGKHISEFPNAVFNSTGPTASQYEICGKYEFLNEQYECIYITTNKDDIIEYVSIYIDKRLDKSFYNLMVDEYGKHSVLYEIDGFTIEEEEQTSIFKTEKVKLNLKECEYKEDAFLWIWNETNQKIEIKLPNKMDSNTSTMISIGDMYFKH